MVNGFSLSLSLSQAFQPLTGCAGPLHPLSTSPAVSVPLESSYPVPNPATVTSRGASPYISGLGVECSKYLVDGDKTDRRNLEPAA